MPESYFDFISDCAEVCALLNLNVVIEALTDILGPGNLSVESSILKHYGTDWSQTSGPDSEIVVFPSSEDQISNIMKLCSKRGIPVVPSGGRTGLAGGARGGPGQIILSLDKMSRILSVDPVNMSIEAQAGATTQQLQEAAEQLGLFFPIDLAAKGSCQIGGNIATNAGGLRFVRFGGTREQVLGLRVVLANGECLDMNKALRKNNTGYDLKQMFIGSEGTLGIITTATLCLTPRPLRTNVCLVALDSIEKMLSLFSKTRQEALGITAFEWIDQRSMDLVLSVHSNLRSPFDQSYAHYVLMEVECPGAVQDPGHSQFLERFLEPLFESGDLSDAVIAGSADQERELWALREHITESLVATGHVRKNDISLPLSRLCEFHKSFSLMQSSLPQGISLMAFGHIGDGNLHINYLGSKELSKSEFSQKTRTIELNIYQLTASLKGSISAEHGIGLLKKNDLHFSRSHHELSLMQSLKSMLDPQHLLNPGKILNDPSSETLHG